MNLNEAKIGTDFKISYIITVFNQKEKMKIIPPLYVKTWKKGTIKKTIRKDLQKYEKKFQKVLERN